MQEELEKIRNYKGTLDKLVQEKREMAQERGFYEKGQEILRYLSEESEDNNYEKGDLRITLEGFGTQVLNTQVLKIFYKDESIFHDLKGEDTHMLVYEGTSSFEKKGKVDVTTYIPIFSWEDEFASLVSDARDHRDMLEIEEQGDIMAKFGITRNELEEAYQLEKAIKEPEEGVGC